MNYFLQEAKHAIYRDLWNKIQRDPRRSIAKTSKEAWSLLQNEPYIAYTTDKSDIVQKAKERTICNGILLPEEYYKSGLGIVVKQGSPHRRHFDLVYVYL